MLLSCSRICLGIVFLSAFLPYAASQQGGTGGSAGNTGESGRKVAPQRPQFPPAQTNTQTGQPASNLAILSGAVVLEDGSPPPFGAVIEMDCGGAVSREAVVGLNGRFHIQVGGWNNFNEVFADASRGLDSSENDGDASGRTNSIASASQTQSWPRRRILGCELQARVHGYRSTKIGLREEPGLGQNEIGTIVIYPYAKVQGSSVNLTTLLAPKKAKNLLDHAWKAIGKGRFSEAEELLRSAVREYPKYAEAWFLLGEVCEKSGRIDEARDLYYEALKADAMYVKPYIHLTKLASIGKRWREAADLSEKLLELDPVTLLECYFLSALAHLNLNELDLAESRAEHGQRIDVSNRFPQFCLIRANIFAIRLDSASAAAELRRYLRIAPNASNAGVVRAHLYQMEGEVQTAGH
jgi:hypothetical protein